MAHNTPSPKETPTSSIAASLALIRRNVWLFIIVVVLGSLIVSYMCLVGLLFVSPKLREKVKEHRAFTMQEQETHQPLHVVLCYAEEDIPNAFKLYEQLEHIGVRLWPNKQDMLLNQHWQQEIDVAAAHADVLILCLSPKAIDSHGALKSPLAALLHAVEHQGHAFVIATKLAKCAVPNELKHYTYWINLFDPIGYQRVIDALRPRIRSKKLGIPLERRHPERPWNFTPIHMNEWRDELLQRPYQFGISFVRGYWCYVPSNEYQVGGWHEESEGAYITLPNYWIARFPVTVAQYTPFVAVGYTNLAHEWWSSCGWQWKNSTNHHAPALWHNQDFRANEQPIIGLSWYEANAFAYWLTHQLAPSLPNGYVLRLPTEAEWEVAAAYDNTMQRHLYPWGDYEPVIDSVASKHSTLEPPLHIGWYLDSEAACGALDMTMHITEWTTSRFEGYPMASQVLHTDATPDDAICLRGGSWMVDRVSSRCDHRRAAPAQGSTNMMAGLRLVLAPRS